MRPLHNRAATLPNDPIRALMRAVIHALNWAQPRALSHTLAVTVCAAGALLAPAQAGASATAAPVTANLPAVAAKANGSSATSAFDGVVEAVRQTVVAAQVPGAVVQLLVKVGDRVSAGQVLLRLDARSADQNAAAGDAQVLAAQAALDLASQDVERQRQLAQKNFISQSALDRAESQFRATRAQVQAQLAQAGAARTQSGLFVVRAPFAGVVSEVPVALGDMAMPGRALVTLYDPTALRVSAAVPQTIAARLSAGAQAGTAAAGAPGQGPAAGATAAPSTAVRRSISTGISPGLNTGPNSGLNTGPSTSLSTTLRIELPGLPAAQQWVQPLRTQVLPAIDPATHTVQLRADLPPGLSAVSPGQYARLWLPLAASGQAAGTAAALTVPLASVVRRAELTGLYVLDSANQPVLRQVRLGRVDGDQVQVLSGLTAGERVVSDPQAAARALPAAH